MHPLTVPSNGKVIGFLKMGTKRLFVLVSVRVGGIIDDRDKIDMRRLHSPHMLCTTDL